MILLADHDEPLLAAKKKQRRSASSTPTSTPKNRVWGFDDDSLGRPCSGHELSWETAIGSVQYSYENASGRANYYTRDHLGSIRELVSSSGTILTRYGYDPYGRTSTSYLSGSVDATKQYEGMYLHQPSGLNLTRGGDGISTGRPYDSNTGRWLSRDPIAERGGINLYEFVLDDPTDHNDPFGLFRDCDAENIACFRKCYAKRAPWPVECKEYTPAQNKAFRYIWCEKKCNAEMMECKAANAAEAAGDAAKAVVQWCQKNPVLCAGGAVIIIVVVPKPVLAF